MLISLAARVAVAVIRARRTIWGQAKTQNSGDARHLAEEEKAVRPSVRCMNHGHERRMKWEVRWKPTFNS